MVYGFGGIWDAGCKLDAGGGNVQRRLRKGRRYSKTCWATAKRGCQL